MKDNVINIEFEKDGKWKRKPTTYYTGDYSSMFEDPNDDIIKVLTHAYTEIASGKDSEVGSDTMSNESFDTFFKEIKEDMREREARTREEIMERERRFEGSMTKFQEDNKEREERILTTLSDLEKKIEDNSKNMERIRSQNFWGNIALFVGMLAIVITLIVVVFR